jgi:hypothetical protein
VADGPHPSRQYAGLALVVIAYVGGIIGWSCAVLDVSSPSTSNAKAPAHSSVCVQATLEEQWSPPSSSQQAFSHAQFDHVIQNADPTFSDSAPCGPSTTSNAGRGEHFIAPWVFSSVNASRRSSRMPPGVLSY